MHLGTRTAKALLCLLAAIAALAAPRTALAQEAPGFSSNSAAEKTEATTPAPAKPAPGQAQDATKATGESTIDTTAEAGEPEPRRRLVHWNEYEGPHFTIRFGAGFLYEVAGYGQDDESKEQFTLQPDETLRDFRLLFRGRFPSLKRKVTWCAGIMYDGANDQWLMRKTGIQIAVPEIWGHIFIGRQKEGFSLNKIMVGYDGWTMERATINDATIPILADGIQWMGYVPKYHLLWNLGYYNDFLSYKESFSTHQYQVVSRLVWLPIINEKDVLHLGAMFRYGEPEDRKIQHRSRPEANPAPYFVDTGKFDAVATRMAGWEVYYRKGPWLFGSEYWFNSVNSVSQNYPLFHGGEVAVSWAVTGETRAYNTVGGYFRAFSPAKPVFQGGPGGWEVVLRYSHIDLDSGPVRGGKFGRITPMVNWHLSDHVRLEMAYGYGHLDRFEREGNTHFFQSRIQLQF